MDRFYVKLLGNAKVPTRKHPTDAGLDLYATEEAFFTPGHIGTVGTGISIAVPKGYAGFVQPRSGLARKNGLTVLNTPGLIDEGYTGEVGVILYNASRVSTQINEGDRIAQLVFVKIGFFDPLVVESLEETSRGESGFGSTGV